MRNFSKIILLFFYCSITCSLHSQEIKTGDEYTYARKIVDTMGSASMHGRGYVNDGDAIAANYLKTEFQKFNLKQFNGDYFQKLSFAVNTFPEVDHFNWKGLRPLVIGEDYIIAPSSGTAKSYSEMSAVEWLDSTLYNDPVAYKKFVKKNHSKSYIAVDLDEKLERQLIDVFQSEKIRGLIFIKHKKLTADFEQMAYKIPVVELLLHADLTLEKLKNSGAADMVFTNKFLPNHAAQNVIGYVQGSEHPDSFIVFTAHYDHIGEMGKALFPGANDNASGCAMLLNLARYYSMPEHKPKCSIAFMAFCGEEVGLLGSRYYTEHPLFSLKEIKFLLNMDIMGTGEDGITVVNGTLFKPEFDKLKQINTENNFIKDVKIRGKAANSDHYFFSENGVRACFIYTMGGIKAYHDVYDKPETLPLNEFENLFKLIVKFENYLDHG